MRRLWITRPLPKPVIDEARALPLWVEVRQETSSLTREEIHRALQEFDIVLPTLGDLFSADVVSSVAAPRCKLLANFGVGYNHIDVAAAREAGIQVTNTPGAVTDATADIAITLMLMSARRAGEGERMVRSGQWQGWHPTQMLGMHLSGRHVGIVGMGRIGQAISRRCHYGFGMNVSYVNRSAKDLDFEARRVGNILELAATVDVLVIAVPGGAETHHLIQKDVFAAMQKHAHFINIARGDVVKEADLVIALETGQIAGAGLDVYENEPEISDPLLRSEKAVLLPHLGTAALDVRESMGKMAVANIKAYLEGHPLPDLV